MAKIQPRSPAYAPHEYPFCIGGLWVSGANINGVTYTENMYVYRQRSDCIFDLILEDGTVFKYVELVCKDKNGKSLNSLEPDDFIVTQIPLNTFFVKIYRKNIDPTVGFLFKPMLNYVVLCNGNRIYDPDFTRKGDAPQPSTSPKVSVEADEHSWSQTPDGDFKLIISSSHGLGNFPIVRVYNKDIVPTTQTTVQVEHNGFGTVTLTALRPFNVLVNLYGDYVE